MAGDEPQAERRELLGRQRAQGVQRERLGIGAVDHLQARPFEARQLGQPGALRGRGVRGEKRRQPRADLTHRRMLGPAGVEVVEDELMKRDRPQRRRRLRVFVGKHVVDADEVHVSVDLQPRDRRQPRIARHHLLDGASRLRPARSNRGRHARTRGDELIEPRLDVGELHVPALGRAARAISPARRTSAQSSSSGGMWSSRSINVATSPNRLTA